METGCSIISVIIIIAVAIRIIIVVTIIAITTSVITIVTITIIIIIIAVYALIEVVATRGEDRRQTSNEDTATTLETGPHVCN